MNPHTELHVIPEVQRVLDVLPVSILQTVAVLWLIALIFIPFFLWGIYSQAHKQTKLLREMLAELKQLK